MLQHALGRVQSVVGRTQGKGIGKHSLAVQAVGDKSALLGSYPIGQCAHDSRKQTYAVDTQIKYEEERGHTLILLGQIKLACVASNGYTMKLTR